MTQVFDELGWVDVYRRLYPDATGDAYTCGGAIVVKHGKRTSGWRIDYQIWHPCDGRTCVRGIHI